MDSVTDKNGDQFPILHWTQGEKHFLEHDIFLKLGEGKSVKIKIGKLRKLRIQKLLSELITESFPSLTELRLKVVKSKDKDEFLGRHPIGWV